MYGQRAFILSARMNDPNILPPSPMRALMDAPTMRDFEWSPREIDPAQRLIPGDLWCVRDAFCALLGWKPGSDEWKRSIEAPTPDDMDRLIDHLGLVWFDPEYQPHWQLLQSQLDHPGISFFTLHSVRMSHCMYQPHLRHLLGLPPQYASYPVEMYRIVVDTRQLPAACMMCSRT